LPNPTPRASRGRHAVLAVLTVLSLALPPSPSLAALGERHVDPGDGFSIRPPQGWEILPNPAAGVSVAFRGPREGDFAPSINVAVLPTPLEITPQAIRRTVDELQAQFAGASPPPLAKDLAGKVPPISNYRVMNARIVTLFGANAGFLESAYEQGGGVGRIRVRNFQVILSGPGRHYVLTYTAPADRYDRFEAEAQESVNSFAAGAGSAGATGKEPFSMSRTLSDFLLRLASALGISIRALGRITGSLLALIVLLGVMIRIMRGVRRRRRR